MIEVLVVISVIATLLAILMPALGVARSRAQELVCRSNLRQILIASASYATEYNDFYVPAASDMWDNAGLQRWHGTRDNLDEPFDPLRGPLAGYVTDGQIKECPAAVDFVAEQDWNTNFERGCGGYGYNMTYIGSRLWEKSVDDLDAFKNAYWRTTHATEISMPCETLMFGDAAMCADGRSLMEYSFAEPPFTVYSGQPITSFYMSPSLHFRHRGHVNVGWADGHVWSREMADFKGKNAYGVDSSASKLGWFEPVDNTPFDLQ